MFLLNRLVVALLVGVFNFGSSSAFSQSTPPLDQPIKKTPIDQMSESGRIQDEKDRQRSKTNSPDSDENQQDNSVTPPYSTKPIAENPSNAMEKKINMHPMMMNSLNIYRSNHPSIHKQFLHYW